jgi:5-bromo-4-chloroindolyl phosphate hydrolysis protein
MSELVKKDVKYINKDFAQFRQNLINFAKNYFPKTYQDFNESSPII